MKKPDIVIPLLLILGCIIFFYEPLFTRDVKIQWDAFDIHYPELLYASRTLHEGHVPFWNQYIFCGYPFIGNPQSGSFYPIHFLVMLLREITPVMLAWITVFHYIIAVLGGFFLSRVLRATPAGACIAGISYGLSGQVLSHATHMGILEYLSLLPWILGLITLGQRRARWELIVLAGALAGFGSLGGHFQTSMYAFTLAMLWLILNPWLSTEFQFNRSTLLKILTWSALFSITVLAVTGVHFFSTAEIASESTRHEISYELASSEALQPKSLASAFLPDSFGGIHEPYWGAWSRVNQQCYAGLITLILAGLMLFQKKNRYVWFFGIITVFGLLFALGNRTPVHRVTLSVIPGWNLVRTPSAFLPFVTLAISMMAGMGASTFTGFSDRKISRHLTTVMVIIAVLGLTAAGFMYSLSGSDGPDGARDKVALETSKFVIILLVSCCVLAFAGKKKAAAIAWLIPLTLFADITLTNIRSDLVFGRGDPYVHLAEKPFHTFLRDAYKTDPLVRIHEWDLRSVLQDNEAERKQYYATLGRISGLHPKRVGRLVRMTEFNPQILDLMRVKYVMVSDEPVEFLVKSTVEENTSWKKWFPKLTLKKVADNILENPGAFPVVFPVSHWRVETDLDSELDLLTKIDFKTSCFLDRDPGIPEPVPGTAEIELTRYDPHELIFDYTAEAPCLMVITDTHFNGWHAFIDDKEVPILRANHAFRAIAGPSGDHTVKMVFIPRAYRLGLFLSCIGAALLCMALVRLVPGRRSRGESRPKWTL